MPWHFVQKIFDQETDSLYKIDRAFMYLAQRPNCIVLNWNEIVKTKYGHLPKVYQLRNSQKRSMNFIDHVNMWRYEGVS